MEAGIYIESKPAPGNRMHGKRHLYLVYRDGKGGAEVIRGGPEPEWAFPVGGDIGTQSGTAIQELKDRYEGEDTPETRGARKLDLGDSDPAIIWRQMRAAADSVNARAIDYDLVPMQNSNSVIRHVIEAAGLDPAKTLPADYSPAMYPGYENDLNTPNEDRGIDAAGRRALNALRQGGAVAHPPAGSTSVDDGTRGWGEPGEPEDPWTPPEDRGAPANSKTRERKERRDMRGGRTSEVDPAPERDVELEQSALRELSAISAEEAVRLKPSAWWTEPEMRGQMRHRDYWSADPSVREPLHDQVAGWHSVHFGDAPVRRDGTGRMIEPAFKIEPPVQPIEPKTADGAPLIQAVGRIAQGLAVASATRGRPAAVQRFQTGLNRLKAAEDEEKAARPKERKAVHRPDAAHKPPALDRVKEDGVFGPKTAAATRKALAARGGRAVEAALDDRDPFGDPSFMAPARGRQGQRVARA